MIIVEKHPRRVRDDLGDRKATDSPVWIYEKGTPLPLRLICSEEHLKEIITTGQAYLDGKYGKQPNELETINADLVSQLEAKDITIEQFQAQIDGAHGNVNDSTEAVNALLAISAAKVTELETKVKELETKLNAKPQGRAPRTAKAKKGGKK